MAPIGPAALFAAWALHDIEEGLAFPATCDRIADATGIGGARMSRRQSWAAVGLMGLLIGAACVRGARRGGKSRSYRAVAAGLEAHVWSHLAASIVQRSYTAGAATALPVMLPGALIAKRELRDAGAPLGRADYARGFAILVPAAVGAHVIARMVPHRSTRRLRKQI